VWAPVQAPIAASSSLVAAQRAEQQRGVARVQAPSAQLGARAGPLDLDDLGAEVAEQPSRAGRGDEVPELEYTDTCQGACARRTGRRPVRLGDRRTAILNTHLMNRSVRMWVMR
jgi:hypothetical protein